MMYFKIPKDKIDRMFVAAASVDKWNDNKFLTNFLLDTIGSVDKFEIVESPFYVKPDGEVKE